MCCRIMVLVLEGMVRHEGKMCGMKVGKEHLTETMKNVTVQIIIREADRGGCAMLRISVRGSELVRRCRTSPDFRTNAIMLK